MKIRFIVLTALLLAGCEQAMEVDPPDNVSVDAITATLRLDGATTPAAGRNDGENPPLLGPGNGDLITLGRVLFYERDLSRDRTVSCASCHRQSQGFSDANRFSRGIGGALTSRQAMSVANVALYPSGRMFWDERAASLEEQALIPIQNPAEMGLSLDEAVVRVESLPYYENLFASAFGSSDVSSDRIAEALAAFQRSIVTRNTRWDEWLQAGGGQLAGNAGGGPPAGGGGPPGVGGRNRPPANGGGPAAGNGAGAQNGDRGVLTPLEEQGRRLFFSNRTQCGACHSGLDLVGDRPRNNGLDLDTSADQGAGRGRFKAASLRNIEQTAPYMHDGRFATLREVIDHYDSGVQAHVFLDNRLRGPNGQPRRLNLSENEKAALEAFLRTLTDESLALDERFSDPFIR